MNGVLVEVLMNFGDNEHSRSSYLRYRPGIPSVVPMLSTTQLSVSIPYFLEHMGPV